MAKIKVELNTSYGCNCMGCGYGSKESFEIEVNEQELEALRKLGAEEISCEAVVEAIENGETALQSLHKQLEEKFYYMVEEYWLYEGDNDCMEEGLAEYIEQDIADGLYTPETLPNESDGFDCHCWGGDEEDCEEDDDEEEDCDDDPKYDLDAYYDWVCGNGHDHAFIAERVGLDLDACRDDEVDYVITL